MATLTGQLEQKVVLIKSIFQIEKWDRGLVSTINYLPHPDLFRVIGGMHEVIATLQRWVTKQFFKVALSYISVSFLENHYDTTCIFNNILMIFTYTFIYRRVPHIRKAGTD